MKNRRGSVLCRCTWYMEHPGSLRECSVSFSKSAATSASCPTFAIQVTANTTISLLLTRACPAGEAILGFLRRCLQLCSEVVHQDGMVPIRSRGNHPDLCAGFLRDECQIVARWRGQLAVRGDALGGSFPPRQFLIYALDLLVTAGLRGCLDRRFPIDLICDTDGNLRQVIKHIQFGHN